VGCSHPGLYRPEWMLNCLTPLPHFLRMFIQPALDGFENGFVFPACDTSVLAWRTLRFDRTLRTFR
jgi:hypothetical protein